MCEADDGDDSETRTETELTLGQLGLTTSGLA